jgi:plastocyanin
MKKIIGLFILVIAIAMISGCTQPANNASVTTPATPMATTVATTVTTEATTIPPTEIPAATPEVTTNATPEITTAVSTIAATVTKTAVPIGTISTKVTTIYIRNNTFVPQELTVLPGTGITWINDDETVHAIKATGSHAGMFNSGDFVKGAEWGYTFGANEGTYEIMDTYSNATCVIVVMKAPLLGSYSTVSPTPTA